MGAATGNSVGPVNNIGFHIPALISVDAGCNAGNSRLRSTISFEQEFTRTAHIIIGISIFFHV